VQASIFSVDIKGVVVSIYFTVYVLNMSNHSGSHVSFVPLACFIHV